ncbi:MAG TPA: hypothetical protein PLE98_02045 [Candidatus Dojkabacteria bacterium]|nr:hypothetical protein [Candidatus Dojkabacteria bacterium]HQI92766.1 hypothetical protein [Candidatus Dojkabacteria bacterium]
MEEPKEQSDQLVTLENETIYYDGITPEELMETLHNSDQPKVIPTFFNNLHLHIIDPIYLQHDDPQFQKDIQEIKEEGEETYIRSYESAEEALRKFNFKDEQYLLLSHIYIKMRDKGYIRYDEKKQCLVR